MRPITDRLKEDTKALHDDAESHAFQKALFAGKLSRDAYVNYLGQMYCLYAGLEAALLSAATREPRIAQVVHPQNYRADDVRRDLAHFDVDAAEVAPLSATADLLADGAAQSENQPVALIGLHYVLEGSNNGNHFIARNIRRAYELDAVGASFMDPYGEQQRTEWAAYKGRLMELELSAPESDALVEAATLMFQGIGRMSTALNASAQPVEAASRGGGSAD